ncbi:MAG: bifunctional (p)ppGpp synthetase/guanosine-3',5'-bis(diphosphate) 3'-pyrophosphohydrolase [Isosphaeraceae bacterium]|nr:bifunctional (p)ppGpp synthetase/guanosine-3',5'-bis(diphosphate) 3'-pyrophosphohydrolase [Isosphaeraceae bacterium]
MDLRFAPISPNLERALRRAAVWHRDQVRKGSDTPYVQHVVGVAWMLDRLGYPEEVVIAGLLHDAVEDTSATLADIEREFGRDVAEIVGHCTEVKRDPQGRQRPWIDRKRDHLAHLADAPIATRAVVLADKLHNLISIEVDLLDGRDVWSRFNAGREEVLWYYRSMIERLGVGDPRLETLAQCCQEVMRRVAAISGAPAAEIGADRPQGH